MTANKKLRILILEDDYGRMISFARNLAGHEYVMVSRAPDCIGMLQQGTHWDIMFLDHDLVSSKQPGTGMDVVEFLAAQMAGDLLDTDLPGKIIIHSLNYEQGRKMYSILNTLGCSMISWQPGNFGVLGRHGYDVPIIG